MAKDYLSVPLHSGALKYYNEVESWSSSDTSSSIDIQTDLSFMIPNASYNGMSLWLKFQFHGTFNGQYIWETVDFGTQTQNGDQVTINNLLKFKLSQAIFSGMQLWIEFEFFNNNTNKLLWVMKDYGTL